MVQSNPKVILLQKLLGECPSNPIPLWSSLCWDDSPLISPTWLGDGKGHAAWSLIGKTNSTPLECFLAGTKGETRLVSHLSMLSIFPRLEDNWCEGFVLQTEEHKAPGLCLHCSEVWFWEWWGEWRASRSTNFTSVQLLPVEAGIKPAGRMQPQIQWSTTLDHAGRSTAYGHRLVSGSG